MKTKEKRDDLKEKTEAVNSAVVEIDEEALAQISGGVDENSQHKSSVLSPRTVEVD